MDIIWHGHACFELQANQAIIATDPFDSSLGLPLPRFQADIVTVSHENPHHSAVNADMGQPKILNGPGEYEIKQIFISGHALYPAKGTEADRNVIFLYDLDGLTVCHMGDISHVPTQSQLEAFSHVDILLIPVGGGKSLNAAKASELISIIEPAIVIPMHYHLPNITLELDPLEKFLKEIGLNQVEAQSKLRISAGNLPEQTETVVLSIEN